MEQENLNTEENANSDLDAVVRSAFIDVKKIQEQFSIACKKYIKSKPHQNMIKALKRTGAF
jgi:hypothetical protein